MSINWSIFWLTFCLFLHWSVSNHAQVILFQEDFGTGCNQGEYWDSFAAANGWTNHSGGSASESDYWYLSSTAAFTGIGNCSDSCDVSDSLSLHVSTNNGINQNDVAAVYSFGGNCSPGPCVYTNRTVRTPPINTLFFYNLQIEFDYFEGGDDTLDNATLWLDDGTGWKMVSDLPKTPNQPCWPHGVWTHYNFNFPQSADNNPEIRIGFKWENNDDGIGQNPSFAVDNIKVIGYTQPPPKTRFKVDHKTTCAGMSLNFADTSAGIVDVWKWQFPGSWQGSSIDSAPQGIIYPNPGVYDVTLITSNTSGTDTLTKVGYITVQDSIIANFDVDTPEISLPNAKAFITLKSSGPLTNDFRVNWGDGTAHIHDILHTYTQPGIYTISLMEQWNNVCFDTLVKANVLTVNGGVSIPAISNPDLELYPTIDVATHSITFHFKGPWQDQYPIDLLIYNTNGQIIHHQTNSTQSPITLDGSQFAAGTYFYECRNAVSTKQAVIKTGKIFIL